MDISEIQIGIPAQITPPIDKNLEITKKLDEYGYHSMWYPDHLMGWIPDSIWTPDLIPLAKIQKSPHVYLETFSLIAAHSVITKNIQMGTAVTDTLRRHPAQVAQIMLTLDHISHGRVIFGIGAGEAENTRPYGIDYSTSVSKFEENLRIIKLFLDNPHKNVNFNGKYWKIKNGVIGLEAFERSKPPRIWIAAHGPRMLRLTAELADGWIPISMPSSEYVKSLDFIKEHAKLCARDPAKITPAIYFYTILANDHDDCHKMMLTTHAKAWALTAFDSFYSKHGFKHPLAKIIGKETVNPLTDYIPNSLIRAEALNAIEKVPSEVSHNFFLHGNFDDLLKNIEIYSHAGVKHFVFWNFTGMFDIKKYSESNKILLDIIKYIKG